MSIRYFTTTAATGTGSLYETVLNAEEWDTVAPDPETFPAGSKIEIELAGYLTFKVPVRIDAGKTRIILTRASKLLIDNRGSTGFSSFNARGVTFNGRILLGGVAGEHYAGVFTQCVFSCGAAYASLQLNGYADVQIADSAFIGGLGRPIYSSSVETTLILTGCTVAANKLPILLSEGTTATYTDCIIEPDLAAAPFMNVPTTLDGYDAMNPPPFMEWDYTPTLESGYAEGAATAAGQYDIDGIERGRVLEDGSTVYALGACEYLDAAFWAGKDSDGNIVAPAFNSPAGWSSYRNATKGNLDAPPEKACIIGQRVQFSDDPNLTALTAANSSVSLAGTAGGIQEAYLDQGGELTDSAAAILYLECAEGAGYFGDWSKIDAARIKTGASVSIGKSAQFQSLTVEDGATIEISDGVLVGVDNPTIEGGTIRAATRAYFAIAPTEDASKANLENIVLTPRGAGIKSFYATAAPTGGVTFSLDVEGSTIPVLIEKWGANEWATLYPQYIQGDEGEEAETGAAPFEFVYRACDGVNFYIDVTTIPATIWFTKCWAVNQGGGGGDPEAPTWKVTAWGVDPQLDD